MRRAQKLPTLKKHRAFSGATRIPEVRKLPDWSVTNFRRHAFEPELPAFLPAVPSSALPAASRWFQRPPKGESDTELRLDYFEQYGDTIVPLEITTTRSDSESLIFQRNYAPLELFLESVKRGRSPGGTTIYLAQCQLQDLPLQLRQDLPTPDVVLRSGKGDVYDMNLWMGLPPTHTPLHRDPNHNLFIQLSGLKLVRLYPPETGASILARVHQKLGIRSSTSLRGEEMMQGEERTLLDKEVWNSVDDNRHCQLAKLNSGEALFIPLGWWHSIKGIGSAISTSVNYWFR